MPVQFFFNQQYWEADPFTSVLPPMYEAFVWDRAELSYTQGKFGEFLTQEIRGNDYSICEYRFCIRDKIKLYPYSSLPLLTLLYILKGTVMCKLKGCGELWLAEGHYYFVYIPPELFHEVFFEQGDFIFFHVNVAPEYLSDLAAKHLIFDELIRRHRESFSQGTWESGGPITIKERRIIDDIISVKEENEQKDIFMRARIYDLLLLYSKNLRRSELVRADRDASSTGNRYIPQLIEVKRFLDNHIGEPAQIKQLSRRVGMNAQVLKKEFKVAFDHTIYAYQLRLRMDRASEMLLKYNVSIDEVAAEVGYKNTSSFIKKFKELFGITPYQFHKKYIQ